MATGVAISPGERPRSFCRWVANRPQIEQYVTMQLAIHQQAVSVLPRRGRLKMANSGSRISRFSVRCLLRFSSQTSGSLTYLRTQMVASAGRTPIHSIPRQPT